MNCDMLVSSRAARPEPRATLAHIPSYVPKPPVAPPGGPAYRLFLNENPYPPLPSVLAVIADAAQRINLYPGIGPTQLRAGLADRLGVPVEGVVTGPGSIGIYQQIGQALLSEGDEIVYAWPSFEAFPIVTRIAGARPVTVPLADGVHDLTAMAAAVTSQTRAVLVCDANNPTSTAVAPGALAEFLERVPPSVLVVLDEAYHEFARDRVGPPADGVALTRRHPNLIVLRTFSKAYGLAGLRVGYGVAHPALAEAMAKCAVPCGVSGVAEQAAIASLRHESELFARVDALIAERERIRAALLAAGVWTPPSQTNFLWFPLGEDTEKVAAELTERGVLGRAFSGAGIRVSIGDRPANDLLVAVLSGAAGNRGGALSGTTADSRPACSPPASGR
jgi:histidinol-phosphate aminotransferase